jgi:hypothetical protein
MQAGPAYGERKPLSYLVMERRVCGSPIQGAPSFDRSRSNSSELHSKEGAHQLHYSAVRFARRVRRGRKLGRPTKPGRLTGLSGVPILLPRPNPRPREML